jgi:hypothetical protein
MNNKNTLEEALRYLESRIAAMCLLLKSQSDQIDENALTGEDILCVMPRTYYDIQFSWGGPSDWVRVYVDEDKDIEHVEYHYADWGTHEQLPLTDKEEETILAWLACYSLPTLQ